MLDILRKGAQSWGIKVVFGIIIAVFVLAFGMDRARTPHGNVLATVNETSITIQQFQERLQHGVEALRAQNPGLTTEMILQMGFKRQMLEQVVLEELIRQKATELGLTVSREELAATIHKMPAFQNEKKVFDPNLYQRVLQHNNLTPGRFESDFRSGLLQDKLRTYLGQPGRLTEGQAREIYAFGRSTAAISYAMYPWSDYAKQVQVTDNQVAEHYASHEVSFQIPARAKVEYVLLSSKTLADPSAVSTAEAETYFTTHKEKFKIAEQVRARHLLVRVEQDAAQDKVDEALERIKKIQAELKTGKSFTDVAKAHSEDPAGKEDGGELGWFGRGRMVKAFEDAAFALQPGVVSEPVRTQFGLHLIMVEEKKPAGYLEFQDVSTDIKQRIAQDKAAEILQDRLDQAQEMLLAGDRLAAVAASLGHGLTVQTTNLFAKGQTPPELASLSPENAQLLFSLALNASTQTPMNYEDGYLLATKVEDLPQSIKPLGEVRASIVDTIVKTEAQKLAKEKAGQDLAALRKNEGKAPALTETPPFTRQGEIPGLGVNQQLSTAAFTAEPGTWLPETYETPDGFALAKAVRVTQPTDEEWTAEKETWLSRINQQAEDQAAQVILADLRARADVRILTPAMLE